jgi:hypothetical protein
MALAVYVYNLEFNAIKREVTHKHTCKRSAHTYFTSLQRTRTRSHSLSKSIRQTHYIHVFLYLTQIRLTLTLTHPQSHTRTRTLTLALTGQEQHGVPCCLPDSQLTHSRITHHSLFDFSNPPHEPLHSYHPLTCLKSHS